MNFEQLIQACEQAHNYLQGTAVSVVNQSLTIRNWLFGNYIVEYEQNGEDRAKYGTELLKKLADRLSGKNIKGLSDRSLRNCRQFYIVYPNINQALSEYTLPRSIWQTPSAKSNKELKHADYKGIESKVLLSRLSFSHIIELAREEDPLKRTFYEAQNKIIKYHYLFKHDYKDIHELRNLLDWIIPDYQYERPHHSLKGLTPYEALTGVQVPTEQWQQQIQEAKQLRVQQNMKETCEIC